MDFENSIGPGDYQFIWLLKNQEPSDRLLITNLITRLITRSKLNNRPTVVITSLQDTSGVCTKHGYHSFKVGSLIGNFICFGFLLTLKLSALRSSPTAFSLFDWGCVEDGYLHKKGLAKLDIHAAFNPPKPITPKCLPDKSI